MLTTRYKKRHQHDQKCEKVEENEITEGLIIKRKIGKIKEKRNLIGN